MNDFLLGIAKGIAKVAEVTGIADMTRKANVQKKSEAVEKNVLDPAIKNTSWIVSNWQFVIIGALAVLVLLRD